MAGNEAGESAVTVVMASYQSARYIERALRSAFTQTAPPREVLLVDDASADETPAILERLQAEFCNLRVARQAHAGLSVALNRAIGLCNTPFLLGLGHDNLLDPRACALLAAAAQTRARRRRHLFGLHHDRPGRCGHSGGPQPGTGRHPLGNCWRCMIGSAGTRDMTLCLSASRGFTGRSVSGSWAVTQRTCGTPMTWTSACDWRRNGPSLTCRNSCIATGGTGATWERLVGPSRSPASAKSCAVTGGARKTPLGTVRRISERWRCS